MRTLTSATDMPTRDRTAAAQVSTVNENTRLAALALAGVCAFLDLYAPQPLLPMLSTLFHTTAGQIGWTISATTLAVAISAPFAGLASDRYGRRPVIIASLFGLAIPSMMAGAVSTLPALIFWRFVAGLFMPGIIAGRLSPTSPRSGADAAPRGPSPLTSPGQFLAASSAEC